jgi:hypothetical protein
VETNFKVLDHNTDNNGGQASNGKHLLFSYRGSILYDSVQDTLSSGYVLEDAKLDKSARD